MFKKSLWFGSILLVLMALFALNGCGGEDSGSPAKEEDPSLQGDLGGIRPGAPVHNAQAQTVITGTNAVARITWGEGVSGGIFRYNGGNPVQAEAVVTANSNYVFTQTLRESDILTALANVTNDIDDEWTLSEDYTVLSFSFSYEVAQAELDLSPLKDIKLVAGSANMPAFINEDILANLDPDAPPVNAYVSAATPETAIETALPAANTPFKVRVEATAAYGYKWPAGFDYQGVYKSAAKVSARIAGSVLSLTLEYDTALQVISAIPAGNILPLFTTAPAGGAQIPVKLLLGTGAATPNFTVEKDLEWTGLTENRSVAFASRSISAPVKLIPNKGYTFTESALTAAQIAEAINTAATFNQKAEDVKKDHDLEFTLTYPVTAVQIAQADIELGRISQNGLSDFYQPRIGQPVYTKLVVHPDAKFTLDSILWSDETGNEALTVYADRVIVASITLRAKPGYTFDKVNISAFEGALTTNFTKDTGKAPAAKVVGTPDETLIFTLTYTRPQINPAITTGSGSSVVAGSDALNAGGGLEELFGAISGNTLTIPKESVTIDLTTPPVIPEGKTLELASGAVVTTSQPLDAAGNITIGTGGSLTVSGGSDITGNVSLGQNSAVSLSGTATTIGGNVTFAQGSGLGLSGTAATIGDSTGKATTLTGPTTAGAAPAPIDLTAGTLNLIGNVTATNVTITSTSSSKIDIPTGALTLGTNASLVLNPATSSNPGDMGTLDGKVIVKTGAAIVDENADLGAWEVGPGGVIEIQYGGKALMYAPAPINGTITAIGTGPTASDPAYSPYVQLRDSTAVFTLKRGEYEVTAGKVYLASPFLLGSIVTVKGELILEDDLTFYHLRDIDGNPIRLVGTSADSKLTIKNGKGITVSPDSETVDADIAGNVVPGLSFSGSSSTFSCTASGDTTYTWNIETNQWDAPTP